MNEKKSLVDLAYEILSERYEAGGNKAEPMEFSALLLEIGRRKGIEDEEKLIDVAAGVYTELTIDGRFVIKGDNTWVLKEHECYDNIHIDMNDAYDNDEDSEDEEKPSHSSDEESDGEDKDEDPEEDEGKDSSDESLIEGSEDEAEVTSGFDDEDE